MGHETCKKGINKSESIFPLVTLPSTLPLILHLPCMLLVKLFLLFSFGDMAANLLLVAVLFVGVIMTACIKENLRRQAAIKKPTAVLEKETGPQV